MNLEKIFALKDVNLMKDLFDKNKQPKMDTSSLVTGNVNTTGCPVSVVEVSLLT